MGYGDPYILSIHMVGCCLHLHFFTNIAMNLFARRQCNDPPYDQLCSQAGYEPGVNTYYEDAWTQLGEHNFV